MKPSLRLVVAILGGLAALVVAATVLSVAATTFQAAAREVGEKYIRSTALTARGLMEDYFNGPVRDIEMIAASYASAPAADNIRLPSHDGNVNATSSKFCDAPRVAQLQNNASYSSLGLFFDDGSVVALPTYNRTDTVLTPSGAVGGPILSCFMVSSHRGDITGVGIYSEVNWFSNTLEAVPDGTVPLSTAEVDVDNKPSVYGTAVGVAQQKPIRPFWAPAQAFRETTHAPAFLTLAVSRAMYNSSGAFLGLFAVATSMDDLSKFLQKVHRSPNTHLFALDKSFYIHGTTFPHPVARVYVTTNPIVPSGCLSTAAVSPSATPGIVCPEPATSYPYQPIKQFMGGAGPTTVSKIRDGEVHLEFIDVDGRDFQTALVISNVPNEAKTFGLMLFAFVDMEDVEGEVRSGIITAIIITAGIFALGVAVIMTLLFIVLKPLEQVARDMDDTANLRFKQEEAEASGGLEKKVENPAGTAGAGGGDLAPAVSAGAYGDGGGMGMPQQSTETDDGGAGAGGMGMAQQSTVTDGGGGATMGPKQSSGANAYVAKMAAKKRGQSAMAISNITEIASLQVAFLGLSAAISSFTKYVPREVVRDLIASNKLASLTMEKVPKVTVMFSHIVGFDDICAKVSPEEMAEPTAIYFDSMYDEISAHGGVIDKFIADCVMCIWGAPTPCANQEVKAGLCALQLARAASVPGPLKGAFDEVGENITVRCGISSGPVIAGNMGSSTRYSWTVLGNTCNLASRTLGTNKRFNTRVLVTDTVAVPTRDVLVSRALIGVKVVGKQEAVMMYELVGVRPGLDLDNASCLDRREQQAKTDQASRYSRMAGAAAAAAGSGGSRDAGSLGPAEEDAAGPAATATATAGASTESGDVEMGDGMRRFVTHTTAAKLLRRAYNLTSGSIIVTPAEIDFCQRYSAAAHTFNDKNPKETLRLLKEIQRDSREFFGEDTDMLLDLVGNDRCEAGLIRAELGAKVLRENAQRCVDDPGADAVMTATGK